MLKFSKQDTIRTPLFWMLKKVLILIWTSIFETQAIIQNNCHWRVGDSRSISIWRDKWLPNDENAMVTTTPFPFLEQALVNSILNE